VLKSIVGLGLILRGCEASVSKDGHNAGTRGHPSRRAQGRAPPATTAKPLRGDEECLPRVLRSAKRCAADPGSIMHSRIALGPGSTVHREERCTASGTRHSLRRPGASARAYERPTPR
jgi:hypothetical protein